MLIRNVLSYSLVLIYQEKFGEDKKQTSADISCFFLNDTKIPDATVFREISKVDSNQSKMYFRAT